MLVASAAKAPARCRRMSVTAGAFVCSKQELGDRASEALGRVQRQEHDDGRGHDAEYH